MKIMIMSDMEGSAGVLNLTDWAEADGRYYDKGKRLLTEEVNAAIAGLCAGGATELVVVDGHGGGMGIDPELLDERAWLACGRGAQVWPWGLDKTFAGLAFVGQHAKAGTPYSHITHTQTFEYLDIAINGLSIGEYGQFALCAMELGVPTILACGEEALAREAEALTPGVVTVAIKRGLLPDGLDRLGGDSYSKAKLSAIHRTPGQARKLIREGAEKAVRLLAKNPSTFHYPALNPPFSCVCRYRPKGDKPAYESVATHHGSIIALMNML